MIVNIIVSESRRTQLRAFASSITIGNVKTLINVGSTLPKGTHGERNRAL